MVGCSVAICRNHSTRTTNVAYHVFPKNIKLRDAWIKKCRRGDDFNPRSGSVCSDHFLESDYLDDIKNRLLGLPQRKLLKEGAIPTINLEYKKVGDSSNEREKRQEQRGVRKSALETLKSLSPKKTSPCKTKSCPKYSSFQQTNINLNLNKSNPAKSSPKKTSPLKIKHRNVKLNKSSPLKLHSNLSPKKSRSVESNSTCDPKSPKKLRLHDNESTTDNCCDLNKNKENSKISECFNCNEKSKELEALKFQLNELQEQLKQTKYNLKIKSNRLNRLLKIKAKKNAIVKGKKRKNVLILKLNLFMKMLEKY
jgi:hypothetical protein